MHKIFNPENRHKLDSDERRKQIPPKRVLDLMNIKAGETLLDIGAGTGFFAIPAINYVGETGMIIASDISGVMLDALRKRLPDNVKNISLLRCNPYRIDLPGLSVDKILMAFVFHEIDDKPRYLSETTRLLRPGGLLAIVEWVPFESEHGPPLQIRIGHRDLSAMAEEAGYTFLKYKQINESRYICTFQYERTHDAS